MPRNVKRLNPYKYNLVVWNDDAIAKYSKKRYFHIRDNKLWYIDPNSRIEYRIMHEDDVQEYLDSIFNDSKTCKTGRDQLFEYVKDQKILGISRERCAAYFRGNQVVQQHKPIKRLTNRPVITHRAGSHIFFDLAQLDRKSKRGDSRIPLPDNHGYNYILAAICAFSKYVWAFGLKTKTVEEVESHLLPLLRDIHNEKGLAVAASDNGSEFMGEGLRQFLKSIGTAHVRGLPYNPSSQGQIERFNRTLKNRIYKTMSINKNTVWIDHLDNIIYNYNHSLHSTTKMKPVDAWNSNKKTAAVVEKNIKVKAEKMLKGPDHAKFMLNDCVRIRADFGKQKSTFQKQYEQKFAPELYRVTRVLAASKYRRRYYYVVGTDDQEVGPLYGSDLIIAAAPEEPQVPARIKNKKIRTGLKLGFDYTKDAEGKEVMYKRLVPAKEKRERKLPAKLKNE